MRLLVATWLLFLLAWGALHVIIVPRIDQLRPQLEERASLALGVPVKMGSIRAQSKGIIPSFELLDVRLLDAQGREALRLPRVLASLSPRSLWNFGFEQLYIDQPELDIRRAKDGKVYIAGLDFSNRSEASTSAADWFFSQAEFALRGGTITWLDELRGAPVLVLKDVDFVARNSGRKHSLRLDATASKEWGERFSIKAVLRQPLLIARSGQWRDWEGQVFAGFERIDLSELRRYLDLGIDLAQGQGAMRAWLDVSRGEVIGAVADVDLTQVRVSRQANQPQLVLPRLSGRVSGSMHAGGYELATQNLQFETEEGIHWPGGNLKVTKLAADARLPERGDVMADQLDLAALTLIAGRLGLEHPWLEVLKAYSPKGLVERVHLNWQGSLDQLKSFEAKGKIARLDFSARTTEPAKGGKTTPVTMLSPGVRSASVEFDFNQSAGRAAVQIENGSIELPGLFDEPALPLTRFTSELRWQVEGTRLLVQLPNMRFTNEDAQGEAQLKWQSSGAKDGANSLGQLDLQGSLSRAQASRVYRYLPVAVDAEVRDYLRAALLKGQSNAVKFKVKGDLDDFPFAKDRGGEFRVSANVRDASFAAVPRNLQPSGALPWPVLTQINAELLIDRNKLQVKDISARLAGASSLRVTRAEANIADYLDEAVVRINAEGRGPLAEALSSVITSSPLSELTDHFLGKTTATGSADVQVNLTVPLLAPEKTNVQGRVTLTNSDILLAPETPRLSRVRGIIHFNETGFAISGGQARMLGGDVRAEGGTIFAPQLASSANAARNLAPPVLRVQGSVTAEGLRQAAELGKLTGLSSYMSGGTTYSAQVAWRRGVPEVLVTSSLQGLTLSFPAPLVKPAEVALPLRIESKFLREAPKAAGTSSTVIEDQLRLELGRLVLINYERDLSGSRPRVLRGGVGIGLQSGESAPTPAQGVGANLNLGQFDLDAWSDLFSKVAGESIASNTSVKSPWASYWPSTLAMRANELTLGGRKINNLVVGGSLDAQVIRLNMDARELSGYLEYRQSLGANPGQVYARLARLSLAQSSVKEVEALLDGQPATVPALDIVIDDMELRGIKLGRVEIEAVNRGAELVARQGGVREWRLNKFNVTTPEAGFSASGNWAALGESTTGATRGPSQKGSSDRRRTVMNFKLDIADSGELLSRLGMKDVIRKGKGRMEGQIAWLGSPLALDYPTLGGSLVVNVEDGQFLKAEPGIAKLLGVLSLQSLPRRLTLDFRDVFSEGFSFDFFRGDVTLEQGIASSNNLQMKGVNAAVFMEGRADIARETQSLKVVVVPEINAGTASLLAAWVNPAVGIGTFLAQLFLRRPLMESATQQFLVEGSWTEPKITKLESNKDSKGEVKR